MSDEFSKELRGNLEEVFQNREYMANAIIYMYVDNTFIQIKRLNLKL